MESTTKYISVSYALDLNFLPLLVVVVSRLVTSHLWTDWLGLADLGFQTY